MNNMEKDVQEILFSKEEIHNKVAELGEEITKDYKDVDNLLVICVLKGAVSFLSDLIQEIPLPLVIDFMDVSSYGSGVSSTGEVRILKDLDSSVEGRNILIVEDIIDTGITLNYLKKLLLSRGAASVEVVTLLTKPSRRQKGVDVKYVGYEIDDLFVVGYGLDYNEKYRNLPYIGYLKEEIYS